MEYVQDRPLSLQVYKTAAEFKAHRLNRTEQCRLNAERAHIARQERIFQKEFRTARLKIETRYARPLSSCQQHSASARPKLASDEPATGTSVWSASGRCSARSVTSDPLTKGGRATLSSRERDVVVAFRLPSRSGDCLPPSDELGGTDARANCQTTDENDGQDIMTTMTTDQDKASTQTDVTRKTRSAHARKTGRLEISDDLSSLTSGSLDGEVLLEDVTEPSSALSSGLRHASRKTLALAEHSEMLSETLFVPEAITATNRNPAYRIDQPNETEAGSANSLKKVMPLYHSDIDNKNGDKRKPSKRLLPCERFPSGRPKSQAGHASAAADASPPGSIKEKEEEASTSEGPQRPPGNHYVVRAGSASSSAPRDVARQSVWKQGPLQNRVVRFLHKQGEFNKKFPLRKHVVTSLQFARPDLLPASHKVDQSEEAMTTRKAVMITEVLGRLGLLTSDLE